MRVNPLTRPVHGSIPCSRFSIGYKGLLSRPYSLGMYSHVAKLMLQTAQHMASCATAIFLFRFSRRRPLLLSAAAYHKHLEAACAVGSNSF